MLTSKTKVGDKVFIEGELASLVKRAGNSDGIDLDYYLVRIPGSSKPVAVFDYAIKSNVPVRFNITDRDFKLEGLPAVARNIREYRQRANLSQQAVADALGVRQSAVTAWEAGINFPRYERVIAMSRLFDVSVDDLTEDRGNGE